VNCDHVNIKIGDMFDKICDYLMLQNMATQCDLPDK